MRASKSRLVLVLHLIGQGSGARFFNQSQSVAMQNQSNCGISFDTQLKNALSISDYFFDWFKFLKFPKLGIAHGFTANASTVVLDFTKGL